MLFKKMETDVNELAWNIVFRLYLGRVFGFSLTLGTERKQFLLTRLFILPIVFNFLSCFLFESFLSILLRNGDSC